MILLEKITITLPGTVGTPVQAETQKCSPAAGRLVSAWFSVPALGDAAHRAKVDILNGASTTVVYMPDTAIGSGSCSPSTLNAAYFSATAGAFYSLPVDKDGAGVRVTTTVAQAAVRTFFLWLAIEA